MRVERIDLRAHEGAHPRIGAADVVPFVPLAPERHGACAARGRGRRRADRRELGLPVFVYAPPERGPAFFRRGGPAELQRRVDDGELAPDFGPARLHESAGGVILGARRPLIAFNVNLRGDVPSRARSPRSSARRAAAFPGVRALGLDLPRAGLVQVSMNVEDWEASALHEIVARIEDEARARGAEVVGLRARRADAGGCCGRRGRRDAQDRRIRRVARPRAAPAVASADEPDERYGERRSAEHGARGDECEERRHENQPVACAPRCVSEISPSTRPSSAVGDLLLRGGVEEDDGRALSRGRAERSARSRAE